MIRYLPAALLAGCTATGPSEPTLAVSSGRTITYETGPCFGTCPVYGAVAIERGAGSFTGLLHTAALGERRLTRSGDYARLDALLAPWRPTGTVRYAMGTPNCGNAPTDMPSAKVTWADGSGRVTGTLDFYYGCADAQPALARALRRVPQVLAIEELVGGALIPSHRRRYAGLVPASTGPRTRAASSCGTVDPGTRAGVTDGLPLSVSPTRPTSPAP